MSKKACTKEAKTKQLAGDEKKQFIKDCEHGKTTE
ncbi:MAG TPA: PsiF family protein [Steroidobacteraceae bacterium]|nr:PsiF family protein [Steroidobacteraceae bacterium]